MIIRALNTIGLVAAMVLAVALYRAKTDAHEARQRLDQLAVMIEDERRAASVLRAEIAFLERPERLRALAARYLGLEPADPDQEMSLERTLLALGVPPQETTRYAAVAPGAAPAAPVEAPAPVQTPVQEPAPVRVAEAAPAPAIDPRPESAPAPTRVAQAESIQSAPLAPAGAASLPAAPLRVADDPIASLIIAAGGLR